MELYDSAGDLPRIISALEAFVAERPEDALAPDAMLRLGQAFHTVGLFDKAIDAYRHNQFRYPKSLAASKSGVPLARAYIAKGPDFYRKAEEVLRGVVEDNVQVTPQATEFRESLFELAMLYYRTGRYELAIARAEEISQRYPEEERIGQIYFLTADSYRKSAIALENRIAEAKLQANSLGAQSLPTTRPALDVAEATQARADRLGRARDRFGRVISYYHDTVPQRDLDKLYQKLAHFYRADCVYDLGEYAAAIGLYGEAAFRYQDDPSALAAYVQIVNANVALGKIEEAKAANERAKWMLRRMPAEAFAQGSAVGMQKQYWEKWMQWAGDVGMFEGAIGGRR